MPPDNIFTVDIVVHNVRDLYTWGFELHYQHHMTILDLLKGQGDVIDVAGTEKEFMPNPHKGDVDDEFHVVVIKDRGIIQVGYTLRATDYTHGFDAPEDGGVLCTIRFTAVEAGESPLDIQNAGLRNSEGKEIQTIELDGHYYGPTIDIVPIPGEDLVRLSPGPSVNLAEYDAVTFETTIQNTHATLPLAAMVRYDILAKDASSFLRLSAGQYKYATAPPPVYLYVNEFNYFPWKDIFGTEDWVPVGTEPWLDAPGDGSYVTGTNNFDLYGDFGFEDITLGPGQEIGRVVLEGFCDGPFDVSVDFDVYCAYPTAFAWFGSLYSTGSPEWVEPRWTIDAVSDVVPGTLDPAVLNDLTIFLFFYCGDPVPLHLFKVDSIRLRVEWAMTAPRDPPVYVLDPGETLTVPIALWEPLLEEIGRYYVTAYVFFSYWITYPEDGPDGIPDTADDRPYAPLWNNGQTSKELHLKIFSSAN
jgi:hypothetical protein